MKKIGSGLLQPTALQAAPELIEIQAFMPMDPGDRERLKRDIEESGEIRDPLKVYTDLKRGQDFILGGYNRWQIALELGIELLPVDRYEGTAQERRELVVKDNLNRRHLTTDQKRELIKYFLKQDPGKSNLHIAKKTGADDKTVGKVRKELESRSEIPNVSRRTDTRGRKQPATKPATKAGDRLPKSNQVQKAAALNVELADNVDARFINQFYAMKNLDGIQIQKIIRLIVEDALRRTRGADRKAIIDDIKKIIKQYK